LQKNTRVTSETNVAFEVSIETNVEICACLFFLLQKNKDRSPIYKNPGECHRIMTFYSVQPIQ
jgi:hypothetical protein